MVYLGDACHVITSRRSHVVWWVFEFEFFSFVRDRFITNENRSQRIERIIESKPADAFAFWGFTSRFAFHQCPWKVNILKNVRIFDYSTTTTTVLVSFSPHPSRRVGCVLIRFRISDIRQPREPYCSDGVLEVGPLVLVDSAGKNSSSFTK